MEFYLPFVYSLVVGLYILKHVWFHQQDLSLNGDIYVLEFPIYLMTNFPPDLIHEERNRLICSFTSLTIKHDSLFFDSRDSSKVHLYTSTQYLNTANYVSFSRVVILFSRPSKLRSNLFFV